MRDAHTLGVDADGVYEIQKEQQPVESYALLACGVPQTSSPINGCEDPAYYLFDIAGGRR